jgi:hypothetical protein
MIRNTTLSTLALAVLLTGVGAAQTPTPAKPVKPATKPVSAMATQKPMHKVREAKPGLLKQAKITADAAEATALAQVPGGKVSAREIEMQKGVLVYSFDVKETGKEGWQEVTVDATTGAVVSTMHESAKAEAAEKAALKHKPAKAKADTTKKPPA